MKPLRGRLIAEFVPTSYRRLSGLYVVERNKYADKAIVKAVGDPSVNKNGKILYPPAKVGDLIYFKGYKPMTHQGDLEGKKQGLMTIWWGDIVGVVPCA